MKVSDNEFQLSIQLQPIRNIKKTWISFMYITWSTWHIFSTNVFIIGYSSCSLCLIISSNIKTIHTRRNWKNQLIIVLSTLNSSVMLPAIINQSKTIHQSVIRFCWVYEINKFSTWSLIKEPSPVDFIHIVYEPFNH